MNDITEQSSNKFYKKDGVPHVVFRLYSTGLIYFMDFTLDIKKGNIVVSDVYVFFSGTLFSEMASEMYYKIVNNEPSLNTTIKLHEQVEAYVASDNYEEAYKLLITIHDENRNAFYNHLLLTVAGNYDIDKFIEAIDYMKKLKPDDKRLHAYLNVQESMMTKDLTNLNTAIEDLKKYVGEDEVFDLYKGILYNNQSNFEQAISSFDLVIAQNPDFFDAYSYKLFNLLELDKNEEAIKVITTINKRFPINEEDLTFDLQEYKTFTELEAYKNIFKSAE